MVKYSPLSMFQGCSTDSAASHPATITEHASVQMDLSFDFSRQ